MRCEKFQLFTTITSLGTSKLTGDLKLCAGDFCTFNDYDRTEKFKQPKCLVNDFDDKLLMS